MNEDVVDHIAELAYLSIDDDRIILNLQENGDFVRIEINRSQLAGLVSDGAKMLVERSNA
jgi:hypothetical protein